MSSREDAALTRLTERLQELGCRGRGTSWQCPAHDDSNPSLSVNLGADGRVLLYCHAGCEVQTILDALGWAFADLFVAEPVARELLPSHVNPGLTPGPGNPSSAAERPELYELLDSYERGEIEPQPVALGELPKRATADHRSVADDLRLLIGLRRADGDSRALPYSTAFCASRMGWDGPAAKPKASRILNQLARWGVIDCPGSLPPRGFKDGTKTYWPPLPIGPQESRLPVEPGEAKSAGEFAGLALDGTVAGCRDGLDAVAAQDLLPLDCQAAPEP